jgi:hypothetical protein
VGLLVVPMLAGASMNRPTPQVKHLGHQSRRRACSMAALLDDLAAR